MQRSGNASTHARVSVTEDALCSKMSHTHTYTATKSKYQQRCQVDNKVPGVLWKKRTKTQSCLFSEGFTTPSVFIKDLLSPYTVYRKRFCAAKWRFAKLRQRVEEAVISLYSIYWTEYALVFVLVMSVWLFMSLFSGWNIPLSLSESRRPPPSLTRTSSFQLQTDTKPSIEELGMFISWGPKSAPLMVLCDFTYISHICLLMHVYPGYMP